MDGGLSDDDVSNTTIGYLSYNLYQFAFQEFLIFRMYFKRFRLIIGTHMTEVSQGVKIGGKGLTVEVIYLN